MYFFEFVADGLSPHVFAWVEVAVLFVLISFLWDSFCPFSCCIDFYLFSSCQPRLEEMISGKEPSPLLSSAFHLGSVSAYFLKQRHKGEQVWCLFFLCVLCCTITDTTDTVVEVVVAAAVVAAHLAFHTTFMYLCTSLPPPPPPPSPPSPSPSPSPPPPPHQNANNSRRHRLEWTVIRVRVRYW